LREERKLRVFENMVLRRIFRPRRYEVTGEWRRLQAREHFAGYCEFPANLWVLNWMRQDKERKQWKFEVLDKINRTLTSVIPVASVKT